MGKGWKGSMDGFRSCTSSKNTTVNDRRIRESNGGNLEARG